MDFCIFCSVENIPATKLVPRRIWKCQCGSFIGGKKTCCFNKRRRGRMEMIVKHFEIWPCDISITGGKRLIHLNHLWNLSRHETSHETTWPYLFNFSLRSFFLSFSQSLTHKSNNYNLGFESTVAIRPPAPYEMYLVGSLDKSNIKFKSGYVKTRHTVFEAMMGFLKLIENHPK